MLRALLADRFRLLAHSETRELPVYNLVKARRRRPAGTAASHRRASTVPPCVPRATLRPAPSCRHSSGHAS
jgi:uncharacterized protein (TIGR03435 family)